jgi:hypothetical protein
MGLKLKVYRKLEGHDEVTRQYFEGRGHLIQNKFVWADGAWDQWATEDLIKHTVGYAVATEDGEIVAEYKTIAEAISAALGATVELKKAITLPDKKEEIELPVEEPADKAKKA